MKNRKLKIGALAAAFVAVQAAIGYPFFRFMVKVNRSKSGKKAKSKWNNLKHIKANSSRLNYPEEYEKGVAWCESQTMEDHYIISYDGLNLHARYLSCQDAKRNVILAHGYKGNAFHDNAKIAELLHENQCNLLFIDQRCCGESEGKYITYGAKEQYDVQKWAYYLSEIIDNGLPIYLYGDSMGATTVLLASGQYLPREVRGIIADCGFTSMRKQIKEISRDWFHFRFCNLVLVRVDFFCRVFAKFRMKDADVSEALLKNERPVLFFHGDKDTYVLPEHSVHSYSICKAKKELVIVPEARHIGSAYQDEDLYRSKLLEFFANYD